MKPESFKFTGGKLLLALVGLLMLGLASTQAQAHNPGEAAHDYTFTIGTAIANNVGIELNLKDTFGSVTGFTEFLNPDETVPDLSALTDVGITFTTSGTGAGTFTGTPTAAVDVTYSLAPGVGGFAIGSGFNVTVYVAPPPALSAATQQDPLTFVAGVAATYTLAQGMGGTPPYGYYVTLADYSDVRDAAFAFDQNTGVFVSKTGVATTDAGDYILDISDDSSVITNIEVAFKIVVLATAPTPSAISFIATPANQFTEGQVFARYVGQAVVNVPLPNTDPKPGTAADTVTGISQTMYMNGCPNADSATVDLQAFGSTGACTQAAFGTINWAWTGQYNAGTGEMTIQRSAQSGMGAHLVEAAWANQLKAVAFSYEVTYMGDTISRNFTYVFYNKPTIAAQTDVAWDGGDTAFAATFTAGAGGYRGGTFNNAFTIDGGALTYGVGLVNASDTALPGIGIEVQADGTPVLTATAYTGSTAAYAATSYELTVGDLDGNTVETSFTVTVTERVVAPTAPVFSATKFEYIFISGDDGARGNIGIAGTPAEQVAAGLVYETSPALPSGLTIATTNATRGAYLANTTSSTNIGWTTYTLTATASNSGGSATSAGVPLILKVVSQPDFAEADNINLTFYQSPPTTITMPKLNVGADLPFTRYAFGGSQSALTTCGLKNVPVGNGRSSTPDVVISSDSATQLSADCNYNAHSLSGYYNTEAGFKRGQVRGITFIVLAEAPLPTFGTQQGDVTYTAGHASVKTLVEAGGAGNFAYTIARIDGGAVSALSLNADRELSSTTAIAAADAGRYELTATDTLSNSDTTTFSVLVAAALEFPDDANPGDFVAQLGDTLNITIGNAVGGAGLVEYGLSAYGSFPSDGDDIFSSSPGFGIGLRYNTASGNTPASISGTVTRIPSELVQDFLIEYLANDANGARVILTFFLNKSAPPIEIDLPQQSDVTFYVSAESNAAILGSSEPLSQATSDTEGEFSYALDGPGVALASDELDEDDEDTLFVFDPETRVLRNTTFAVDTTYSANYTLTATHESDERANASTEFLIIVTFASATTTEGIAEIEAEFLPDIGAAVAAETALAIGERVGQVRAHGFGAPYVSIGEQSTLSGFISQHAKPLVDKSIEPKQLLNGSHLSLPLFSNGAFSWIPPMGIWLAVEGRAMSNETDEIKWDGTLGGAYLGIDARIGDSIVGVASATSKSSIDYEDLGDAVANEDKKGEYDLTLSTINPYISWQNGNSDWWLTLGEGDGELIRNPDDEAKVLTTDITLKSVAFGVSRALNQQERRKTRLSASLQTARLKVDGKGEQGGRAGFVAETYKGGLGKVAAEVDLSRTLRGGSTLSPFYQAAALYDYGDNDNGVGMETVGGVRWLSTKRGSGGEMQVRWAAAGDYEEWGAYAQWRLQSGADGQGVSASLRPGYGDSDSADILQNGLPTSLIDGADYELHLDARVGFGLTGARGLVTPFAEWLRREDDVYRLGVDWLPSKLFEANLTGEQYTDEQRVWLKGEVKF